MTMAVSGDPPDVIYGDDERIFGFAELNLLASLEGLAARDGINWRVYPQQVLDGLRVDENKKR